MKTKEQVHERQATGASPATGRMRAGSFHECFCLDEGSWNPTPQGIFKKLICVFLKARYSMPVLMRLSQYYYVKSIDRPAGLRRKIETFIFLYLRRLNEVWNQFEHGADPKIAAGVVFHHTTVCITSETVIESDVHIYRNVTFGKKDGKAPHIKRGAKIASHAIVLGGVVIGEKAIVAPGAVVVDDVPDGKVAAGVPAKIIGDVTEKNYFF